MNIQTIQTPLRNFPWGLQVAEKKFQNHLSAFLDLLDSIIYIDFVIIYLF